MMPALCCVCVSLQCVSLVVCFLMLLVAAVQLTVLISVLLQSTVHRKLQKILYYAEGNDNIKLV